MASIVIVIVLILAALWLTFAVVAPLAGLVLTVLWWILVGYLAGRLLRGRGYGPVGDGLLGLAGGVVGNAIFGILGFWLGPLGSLVAGVLGAVLLVFVVRLLLHEDFAR